MTAGSDIEEWKSIQQTVSRFIGVKMTEEVGGGVMK